MLGIAAEAFRVHKYPQQVYYAATFRRRNNINLLNIRAAPSVPHETREAFSTAPDGTISDLNTAQALTPKVDKGTKVILGIFSSRTEIFTEQENNGCETIP